MNNTWRNLESIFFPVLIQLAQALISPLAKKMGYMFGPPRKPVHIFFCIYAHCVRDAMYVSCKREKKSIIMANRKYVCVGSHYNWTH